MSTINQRRDIGPVYKFKKEAPNWFQVVKNGKLDSVVETLAEAREEVKIGCRGFHLRSQTDFWKIQRNENGILKEYPVE